MEKDISLFMNTVSPSKKQPAAGCVLMLVLLAIVYVCFQSMCSNNHSDQKKPIIAYDVEGQNTLGFVVRLKERATLEQIIIACSKIRDEYSPDEMLTFHFYLPGMLVGISPSYASVFYPTDEHVKETTDRLDPKNREIIANFRGLTPTDATKLNSIVLINPQFKTIIGRFIEDYPIPKIEIFYTDSRENKGKKLFIAKYYLSHLSDTPEIIAPFILKENEVEKLIINEEGDYYILQDNTLCKYAIDEDGQAFYCTNKEN